MNISTIKADDIVQCDVRGARFYAIVTKPAFVPKGLERRVLQVSSLNFRALPTTHITARQVIGHWRKSRQSKS